jgi:VanZ family protein
MGSHERAFRRGIPLCLALITATYASALVVATHYPRPQVVIRSIIERPVIRQVITKPPSDKTLHLWAYAPLAALAGMTAAASGWWSGRACVGVAAGTALFAALDEATQPLPWFRRTADLLDWGYDCLGIAIGLAAVALALGLARRLRPRAPAARGPESDGLQ